MAGLACITHAGGNTVDRRQQGGLEFFEIFTFLAGRSKAEEEFSLEPVDWIDVGVADFDGSAQDRIVDQGLSAALCRNERALVFIVRVIMCCRVS